MRFETNYPSPWADCSKFDTSVKTGAWRYVRPITKAEKCSQCGWCYVFCPAGCISDRGAYFVADLDYCKGCGVCAAVCPINAIIMVPEG